MCRSEELHLGLNLLADDPPVSTKKIIEQIRELWHVVELVFVSKPILRVALMLLEKNNLTNFMKLGFCKFDPFGIRSEHIELLSLIQNVWFIIWRCDLPVNLWAFIPNRRTLEKIYGPID